MHEMGHHLHRLRIQDHKAEFSRIQDNDPCETFATISRHLKKSGEKCSTYLTTLYKEDIRKEVAPYSNAAWEVIAETFAHMASGKKFSDKILLIYDICNGPEFSNMLINGKTYRTYIDGLYPRAKELLPEIFHEN